MKDTIYTKRIERALRDGEITEDQLQRAMDEVDDEVDKETREQKDKDEKMLLLIVIGATVVCIAIHIVVAYVRD